MHKSPIILQTDSLPLLEQRMCEFYIGLENKLGDIPLLKHQELILELKKTIVYHLSYFFPLPDVYSGIILKQLQISPEDFSPPEAGKRKESTMYSRIRNSISQLIISELNKGRYEPVKPYASNLSLDICYGGIIDGCRGPLEIVRKYIECHHEMYGVALDTGNKECILSYFEDLKEIVRLELKELYRDSQSSNNLAPDYYQQSARLQDDLYSAIFEIQKYVNMSDTEIEDKKRRVHRKNKIRRIVANGYITLGGPIQMLGIFFENLRVFVSHQGGGQVWYILVMMLLNGLGMAYGQENKDQRFVTACRYVTFLYAILFVQLTLQNNGIDIARLLYAWLSEKPQGEY